MDQRPRSYWATVVSMRESESGLSGYLIERFGIKTGDLRQDDAHVLARRLREFFEGAVPATAPAMGAAGLMGPSYRDEIMVQMLEMKMRELKRELQGEFWSSRAGALGTTSYEQYYAQMNIRTKGIDQIFPGLKTMPPVDEDHLGTIASHSCRPLLPGKESSENNEMLPGFLKALMSLDGAEDITSSSAGTISKIKVGKFIVEDTHKKMYLGGCAPDLTLRLAGSPLCAFGTIAVIELQTGSLDNKHRGKAVKYTKELLEANPDRPFAFCLLTNTEELQVFRASRTLRTSTRASGSEFVFECSDLVSLCEATSAGSLQGWEYIVQMFKLDASSFGQVAPELTTKNEVYIATSLLGSTKNSRVYGVKDGLKACKQHIKNRKRSFDTELAVLKKIAHSGGHPSLPKLLDFDQNQLLLVTEPVVTHLGGTFSFNTLKDILGALSHMHLNLKLVHRDIEPKHMGLDAQGLPCLIDVGSAVTMDETTANEILSGARPYYSGTLLFASDEVLDGLESGCVCVPKAAQDMVALVKSAYIMVHAGAEQSLMRCFPMNGSTEEKVTAVKSFWSTELSKETPAGNAWREVLIAGRLG
ncbi:hypothetical protein CEUSTIGMA_g12966.t1 [Chlamydomonas eustigma]|uniref:Protein kinase domain-containing protein n=1 Tax=Chlamydomonas eustigma TaxID=1157962 RepID=A0A250XR44_9CHLO|nr:hypothetical protein CEUSTIGMA_g12966.t1 [Chlamydomonas eustigma]|eukprot:GAX85551.1 hypothetical protein CEUSTIGMA_g12966.t1 [Chlamydomonas eustigma]